MASLLYPDDETSLPLSIVAPDERSALAPDTSTSAEGLGNLWREITDRLEAEQRQRQRTRIWDPNNPIGTESLTPEQSLTMPRGDFHPTKWLGGGIWGERRPASEEQVTRFGEGSRELYDQASLLAGSRGLFEPFGPGTATGGATAAARLRPPGTRLPPAVARRLAPEVPEYSPDAKPYIPEGEAAPAVSTDAPPLIPPARPPTADPGPSISLDLPPLERDQLWDPASGAQATRRGQIDEATIGMSPENYEQWKARRAALLPPGVATLNRVGTGERGSASLPDLRNMTLDEAKAAVVGDPHLQFKRPDENIVGAPAGFKTVEDVQRQRDLFDQQVVRGQFGKDWYGRVHGYINELSGGDPILARQIAEEWALTSAQADPFTNTGFSLQARNIRAMTGKTPEIVRTGQQARTFDAARNAQEDYLNNQLFLGRNSNPADPEQSIYAQAFPQMHLGQKTDVYRQHMDVTAPVGTTGTNDIWHGRQLGFVDPVTGEEWDKAFGDAQHKYMDYETVAALNRANALKLGGRNNWTPGEVQASPWVAGKSASLQRRYNLDQAEADRRANATYPDAAPWYTADMPHEQIPGGGTGLTTGTMTPEQWHAASRWVNPGGIDPSLGNLGFLTRATRQGTGVWQPKGGPIEYNPVDVARPQINTVTDPVTDKRTIDPRAMAGLEGAAWVRGLSDMQIGSPVTMWDTRAPSNAANGITIDLGRMTTPAEGAALKAVGDKYKLDFTNRAEGAGFFNWGGDGKATKGLLAGGLEDEIKAIVPDATVARAQPVGPYANYGTRLRASNEGKGIATRFMDKNLTRIAKTAPGAIDALMTSPEQAAKSQMNLRRLQASGQIGARPDYELWQRLIAERGVGGALKWARANGYRGLPAAIAGAGLAAAPWGADNSTDPGS